MSEDIRTRTCEDCGREFETLTALRSHDCPGDEPVDQPSLRAPPEGETFTVEFLDETREITVHGDHVPEVAEDRECVRCGDDARDVLDMRFEWREWLQERDRYPWSPTSWQLPVCQHCYLLGDMLGDAEKQMGKTEEFQAELDEERARFLEPIDTDALVQL
jgi:hypothetical protein